MKFRITALQVSGYRALQKPSYFEFRNPRGDVNQKAIIAGPNGSGKTSLLEAILFGLGLEDGACRGFPKGARVRIEFLLGEEQWRTLRSGARHEWWRKEDGAWGPSEDPCLNDCVKYLPVRTSLMWAYSDEGRAVYAHPNPSPRGVGLAYLNEIWAAIHPGEKTYLNFRGSYLCIVEPSGEIRCPLEEAGDGEKNLLYTLCVLAFGGHSVVLIDSIEQHLHYQLQAPIWHLLTQFAPQVQIILASNASAPWDQAFSFERYFLAPEGDPRCSDLSAPSCEWWG